MSFGQMFVQALSPFNSEKDRFSEIRTRVSEIGEIMFLICFLTLCRFSPNYYFTVTCAVAKLATCSENYGESLNVYCIRH